VRDRGVSMPNDFKNLENKLEGFGLSNDKLEDLGFKEHNKYFVGSSGCKIYKHEKYRGLYFFKKEMPKDKKSKYILLFVLDTN